MIQPTLTLKMTTVQCRNVSHCQQLQSYSGLRLPGRSYLTYLWTNKPPHKTMFDYYAWNHDALFAQLANQKKDNEKFV